ncbi:MAG: PGPGW domain-containing protein [Planctomycetes bacterium]|nr:PGPGW domain-containing protein [Planctomycetota bacterium]
MKKKLKGVAKNTMGFCLIIIGCLMIVTPGPGLFTILAGLYISSFPGKPRLVNRLKRTRFYGKYLVHVESKLKSKFKRKENKKE